uniref:CTL-8 n=2 Tax=Portunus trituberculatus TaxID=210409 RepID=A0A977SR70_PORTR|nr:CTL-8 [Portunus trituberculatus]
MAINTGTPFLLLLLQLLPLLPCLHAAPNRVTECTPPFTAAVGGKCILVSSTSKGSWYNMKDFCETLGGRLLTINTENIHYYVVKYLENNGYTGRDYWVGANNEHADGQYHWLDGSKVKMGTPFWGILNDHQEPGGGESEHCAILFKSDFYFMHDLACNKEVYPICEAK